MSQTRSSAGSNQLLKIMMTAHNCQEAQAEVVQPCNKITNRVSDLSMAWGGRVLIVFNVHGLKGEHSTAILKLI